MIVGEHFQPGHLVFADESHFNWLSLRRSYGWAPHGKCAQQRDFFIRGQKYVKEWFRYRYYSLLINRYSILPALSLDGILHLEVLDHSFTGEEFHSFVEGILDQMQPWPLPNLVLVLDNASIHKIPGIQEMVEAR
jgi:DDE superfamily endonuclease